jgi:chemosensory pili system protein ChpA (sensor histidine kinase/response regulator)
MPRILYAEDNPDTARLVRFFLQGMRGAEVSMCRDGAEALEALADTVPDVVVLDVQMPKVDGLEVLAAMRADPRHAAVPVIFLTSLASDAFREDCIERGAQAVLIKPFNPRLLVEEVRRQLAAAQGNSKKSG